MDSSSQATYSVARTEILHTFPQTILRKRIEAAVNLLTRTNLIARKTAWPEHGQLRSTLELLTLYPDLRAPAL